MSIYVTILSAAPHPGDELNRSGVIFIWRLFYFLLGKDGTEVKMKFVIPVVWTFLL